MTHKDSENKGETEYPGPVLGLDDTQELDAIVSSDSSASERMILTPEQPSLTINADEAFRALQMLIYNNDNDKIKKAVDHVTYKVTDKGLLIPNFNDSGLENIPVGSTAYFGAGLPYGLGAILRLHDEMRSAFKSLGIFIADQPAAFADAIFERNAYSLKSEALEATIEEMKKENAKKGKALQTEIRTALEHKGIKIGTRILLYEDVKENTGSFDGLVKAIEHYVLSQPVCALYLATMSLTDRMLSESEEYKIFRVVTENNPEHRKTGMETLMRYPLTQVAVSIALADSSNDYKAGSALEAPIDLITRHIRDKITAGRIRVPNGFGSHKLNFVHTRHPVSHYRRSTDSYNVEGK